MKNVFNKIFNISNSTMLKLNLLIFFTVGILVSLINKYEGAITGYLSLDLLLYPLLTSVPQSIVLVSSGAPGWTKNLVKLVTLSWIIILFFLLPIEYLKYK